MPLITKQQKCDILKEIKSLNCKISRKQRKEIYEPLSSYITKAIYNQIVRGAYLSDNNYELAKAILAKIKVLIAENEAAMNSL
jgi:hypothetical protein